MNGWTLTDSSGHTSGQMTVTRRGGIWGYSHTHWTGQDMNNTTKQTTNEPPLRYRWERMSWHARARFLKNLEERERAVAKREAELAAHVVYEWTRRGRDTDRGLTREVAAAILADLPNDDPALVQQRREEVTRPHD